MSKACPMELPTVSDSWFDKGRRYWWVGPMSFLEGTHRSTRLHRRKIWSRSTVILPSHPLRFRALLNLFSFCSLGNDFVSSAEQRSGHGRSWSPSLLRRNCQAIRCFSPHETNGTVFLYKCIFIFWVCWRFFLGKVFGMRFRLIDSSWRDVGVGGRRRAWQGQARD